MTRNEVDSVVSLYQSGHTIAEISRLSGYSYTWIVSTLKEKGVYIRTKGKRYHFMTGNGYPLFEGSQSEAMDFFGRSRKTISRYVHGEAACIGVRSL